jgi:hypothetical protein
MIEPARIQTEIEKAWLLHDSKRGRIPNEIQRRVRAFKRELAPPAAAISRTLVDPAWRDRVVDALCKRAKGRERALVKVRKALAGANVALGGNTLAVNFLAPSMSVLASRGDDPGLEQDCVLARVALAWMAQRTATFWSQWIFEAPDHALGRLLQRCPQTDLADCLTEAAAAFLDADAGAICDAAKHRQSIYLRAGDGAFVTEVIGADVGNGGVVLYARARTFLNQRQLSDSQVPVGAAADASASVLDLLLEIARRTWSKGEQTK